MDERNAKIFVMTEYLKELTSEFNENLKIDYDLKKKIGSILGVKQNFFIRQKTLRN